MPGAEDVARRARASSGTEQPMHVVFTWEYAGESGNFRGDGAARVNPPDRFRLDLFSTGEGSLQATLVDGVLSTSGDIEGVELPPTVFLYAMAGVFRPGDAPPAAGYEIPGSSVLEFAVEGGATRSYYLDEGRLTRLEERRAGRRERWIELEWGSDRRWPREARYRDIVDSSGVLWELVSATAQAQPYDEELYVLPIPRRSDGRDRDAPRAGGMLRLLRRRRAAQPHAHRVGRPDRKREHAVRHRGVADGRT
ncbi:MAG: hypothetical protein F4Z59_03695, partial [Gemmatimonadales bacterium]|nr:hypothetical protein [Gemmatimonadales bacterium]